MQTELQPVERSERIDLFDVLRGFALLGILVANFLGPIGTAIPRVDGLVSDLLGVLVDSSIYPLYSFLFGLGFAVQLERAQRRGRATAHLYVRRMLALFLIGTVHAVVIWEGDILVTYALTGLLLIPLHKLPQKAIVALLIVLAALNLNRDTVRTRVDEWRLRSADQATLLHEAATKEAARITLNHRMLASTGAAMYGPVTAGRWKWYAETIRKWADPLTFVLRDVLIFFLIGLLVGRARILHDPVRHRRKLAIAASIGFVCLVGGNLATRMMGNDHGVIFHSAVYAGDLGGTTLYIAGIALLFTSVARARAMLGLFAAPGRMGLTNYLMQSVVMTLLIMPYGLGWQPGTTVWLIAKVVFFFVVQVMFSRWWLARYQYGPAEWLWRSLTYGALQPLRAPRAVAETRTPVGAL
jgi:uncharacterized protein